MREDDELYLHRCHDHPPVPCGISFDETYDKRNKLLADAMKKYPNRFSGLAARLCFDQKRVVFTTDVPFGHSECELKVIELTRVREEIR